MTLDFACDECGQKYRVDVSLSGRKIRCKKCGEAVTVPSPNAVAPTPRSAEPIRTSAASPKLASRPPLQSFGDPPRPKPRAGEVSRALDEEEYDYDMGDAVAANSDNYGIQDEYTPPRASIDDDEFGNLRRAGFGKSKARKSDPAGFGQRFVAHLIDGLILMVLFVVAIFSWAVVGVMASHGQEEMPVIFLIMGYLTAVGGFGLYSALMTSSSRQATLGKMAAGVFVTDLDGRRISFGRALGRAMALMFLTGLVPFGLGFLMAAFTENKQALHDKIAGTLVRK